MLEVKEMPEELNEVDMEIYKTICERRFTTIETKQDKVLEDVMAIRQKIFNGHTKDIEHTRDDLNALERDIEKKFDDLIHQKHNRWAMAKDLIIILFGLGTFVKVLIEIVK